jgi:hypothetical protein
LERDDVVHQQPWEKVGKRQRRAEEEESTNGVRKKGKTPKKRLGKKESSKGAAQRKESSKGTPQKMIGKL